MNTLNSVHFKWVNFLACDFYVKKAIIKDVFHK